MAQVQRAASDSQVVRRPLDRREPSGEQLLAEVKAGKLNLLDAHHDRSIDDSQLRNTVFCAFREAHGDYDQLRFLLRVTKMNTVQFIGYLQHYQAYFDPKLYRRILM